jgi:hypothetical protein
MRESSASGLAYPSLYHSWGKSPQLSNEKKTFGFDSRSLDNVWPDCDRSFPTTRDLAAHREGSVTRRRDAYHSPHTMQC